MFSYYRYIYIFIYQNIFYVAPCSIYMHYISMFGFRQMIFTNMIYPWKTQQQTQTNTLIAHATSSSLFCMFDWHLKKWTDKTKGTKPYSNSLHFQYANMSFRKLRTFFWPCSHSLSQNNFAAISHFCATRMLLVRTWTVLAILHERPVASSAIWVAKRAGLSMYSSSLTRSNCTARSCATCIK